MALPSRPRRPQLLDGWGRFSFRGPGFCRPLCSIQRFSRLILRGNSSGHGNEV
jgi:hypothetical protein